MIPMENISVHDTVYEYMVIGKGLLGAAAARHLSTTSQCVALIGPDEPPDRASHQDLWQSYDEGRITRILDPAAPEPHTAFDCALPRR
jgi:sarcosine oxidase